MVLAQRREEQSRRHQPPDELENDEYSERDKTQPGALMLSPRCLIDCGGNGACDWMGFCKCKAGFWGPDCGVTHAAHRHSLPHGPRIVRAARDPSTRARPRGTCPRIHVPTLPPLLRFEQLDDPRASFAGFGTFFYGIQHCIVILDYYHSPLTIDMLDILVYKHSFKNGLKSDFVLMLSFIMSYLSL